jgi:C-terminal processing protease CtpA/Prc
VAAVCVFAFAPSLGAAADPRVERLARLARLWGEVKYSHPWIYTRQVDWDAALLSALPRVRDAATPDAEIAALRSLLASLRDPSTILETGPATPAPPDAASRWEWPKKDVLAVRLVRLASFDKLTSEVPLLAEQFAKARVVVLDVRSQPGWRSAIEDVGDELELLLPHLTATPGVPPVTRAILRLGYPGDVPGLGQQYSVNLIERLPDAPGPAPVKTPAGQTPSARKPDRVVLLADSSSPLPLSIIGAIQTGSIRVVAQGPLQDSYAAGSHSVPVLPGVEARLRTGDLDRPLEADVQVPAEAAGDGDRALEFALAWAQRKKLPVRRTARAAPPPQAQRPRERPYADTPLPDAPHRLLALFRFWNAMQRTYPYRHLLDQPWEAALPAMIPEFEAANTERDYLLALNELGARLQDAHVRVVGTDAARNLFGAATLPIRLQLLEGQAVVTEVLEDDARKTGLAPGDAIVAVDGEPIGAKAAALEKYVSAATPLMLATMAHRLALRGPLHSVATVSVLGEDGTREVKLTREKPFYLPPVRGGAIVQILDGHVGYVDLARLAAEAVDEMFVQVMETQALIFDMRGYPKGTAWPIAPRLNRKNAVHAAIFRRPLLSGGLTGEESSPSLEFHQLLPVHDGAKYLGRVFMLIDENAISQAEHTALFFEAACDVTFVGSNTAGTNGDVTAIVLPGGVTVSFTGHDVRHVDGRQLQRIGIQPQVAVRPTRAGLRAGRDEVLDRALELARSGAPKR